MTAMGYTIISSAERVINVWNCLPPSVDNYSTLATFRRTVDGIDFTSSLKCDTD